MRKYRAALFMTGAAIISVVIHYYWTGWIAAVHQAELQGQSISLATHTIDWLRDTFENLQAEFWQLAIQFALLAGFFDFIRVHSYDEDQEEIKQRLARIETLLEEQLRSIPNDQPER